VFLHWAFAPEQLRALVPRGLALDLHEGQAWLGVTPFSISRMRPSLLPALPVLSQANEVNVRVYVEKDGVPGIWFPSLEITNPLAKWAARLAYRLPYFHAAMQVERRGAIVRFRSERRDRPPASLDVQWRLGPACPSPQPGTLEDFLIERYVLYAGSAGRLLRARIHHRPWPLRDASVLQLSSTLLEANGLPTPTTPVLAHAQAEPLDVEVWPPSWA
jgi:uncharacterized protein YqjF (DUF2071 family)